MSRTDTADHCLVRVIRGMIEGVSDNDSMHELTEGQFLSQCRREGRDAEFQGYLLHRRVRILGAVVVRDLVAPWADPVCDWLERGLKRIPR